MPSGPLSPDLCDPLPPILAGPIVRRLTRSRVYVWLATSVGSTVTLKIRQSGQQEAQAYPAQPVQVGKRLWLSMLEAQGTFQADLEYEYWVEIDGHPVSQDPTTYWRALAYGSNAHPSFLGLPANADQFRILHASCRKPHGGGRDGMALVDTLITQGQFPEGDNPGRPHLMFLTGDQIYADDVGAPLTPIIRKIRDDIVGMDESSAFAGGLLELKVNGRQQACYEMGLTADVGHDHLWTLGEYYAMYLLTFGDAILWPELPAWSDVYLAAEDGVDDGLLDPFQDGTPLCSRLNVCVQCGSFLPYHPPGEDYDPEELEEKRQAALAKLEAAWTAHYDDLIVFRETLPGVRRLLANVPSYMLLDDHEVTDDWNLNYDWAQTIYAAGSPGQRVVTNALLAYILFQHWGNVPEAFQASGSVEEQVLAAATPAQPIPEGTPFPHPADATPDLPRLLGVPDASAIAFETPAGGGPRTARLRDLGVGIAYHYTVGPDNSYPFRVIAIDGRTHREFVEGKPMGSRLTAEAIEAMIPPPGAGTDTSVPTILIIPTPLLSTHLIEHYVQPVVAWWDFGIEPSGEAFVDYEVNWLTFGDAFQQALGNVAAYQNAIVLAGDVHYGFTKRLGYFEDPSAGVPSGIVAHLTSSSARNAEIKTLAIHTFGEALMKLGLTRTRTFWRYPALGPAQLAALQGAPGGTLPWDEALDVVTGRVLREGLEAPAVFAADVARAYNLDGLGTPHDLEYTIDHYDEEPPADQATWQAEFPEMLEATLEAGTAGSWTPAGWTAAAKVVRGLRAADLHRIGRVFAGLPQMALVTMTLETDPTTGQNRLNNVRHRIYVPLGRFNGALDDPEPWYMLDTAVPFAWNAPAWQGR
jgi:hypothetical protein